MNSHKALKMADDLDTLRDPYDSAIAAELRRLREVEEAFDVWLEKTGWVQGTAQPCELGMHRADVLRWRIDRLTAENKALLATKAELVEALREIEWCNDTIWQRDRARAALAKVEAT